MAGDAGFIAKAEHRIQRFVEKASIMVLASHSQAICRRFCNRGIWMETGQVRAVGPIDEILDQYAAHTGQ
jgi:ABC-2 type transport system ATP-binding protein/lipopolysaccharide transport system ATP-binding protein